MDHFDPGNLFYADFLHIKTCYNYFAKWRLPNSLNSMTKINCRQKDLSYLSLLWHLNIVQATGVTKALETVHM